MRVIVAGCGRSGSNMAKEILALSPDLSTVGYINRRIFLGDVPKPGTIVKIIETIGYNANQMLMLLKHYKDIKVIWPIRDPRDIMLSMMFREVDISVGGDVVGGKDIPPNQAFEEILKMRSIYDATIKEFPNRIHLFRMENAILNFEKEVSKACNFLGIRYDEKMKEFPKYYSNHNKRKRYKKIDTNEVAKWKHWGTVYNNYFTKRNLNMQKWFDKLKEIIVYFNYEFNTEIL